MNKHARPGNLDSLVVPRVNSEIWANMSHAVKRVDLRTANTQNIVSKVGTIIAKCTDNLLKARKKDAKEIDLDEIVDANANRCSGFIRPHTKRIIRVKARGNET